jgi:uncharacterized membrane protein
MRAPLLAAVVVALNAAGNYALNWGMKHGGFLAPWTVFGIALLIAWTLSRIKLLALADLSYVLPVTSVGYLIPLILGAALLGEPVSAARWFGGALIVAGAALVTPSPARTA